MGMEKEEIEEKGKEIILPRPGLDPQMMRFLMDLPQEKRNSLLNLSDEELAQMGPEELEDVLKRKEHYIEVKKADREVQAMLSEEQFAEAVQEKMEQYPGMSQEDAETLVLKATGRLGKPFHVIQRPPENTFTKMLEQAAARRMEELLFGKPKDGSPADTGAKQAPDLEKNLKLAQEMGVDSIVLPGGGIFKIGKGDSVGSELVDQMKDYIKERLPTLFNPPNGGALGNLSPEQLAMQRPEILKIFMDDKAKMAEIDAAKAAIDSRNATIKSVADTLGLVFRPGGAAALKEVFSFFKVQNEGDPENTPSPVGPASPEIDDKFPPLECANEKCKHVQFVQRGTQKYVCENCGEENIVDWT